MGNQQEIEPSDLVHGLDYYELISSLDKGTRITLAEATFQMHAMHQTNLFGKGPDINHLRQEVEDGVANVAFIDGEMVRTVFMIGIRISQESDPKAGVLVQVGEMDYEGKKIK